MGDEREILRFLHGVRGEHREARLTARHNIAVVTKNAKSLTSEGARRNMEHRRGQLARNFIHIRNHQEKSLRSREGRRERTGRE